MKAFILGSNESVKMSPLPTCVRVSPLSSGRGSPPCPLVAEINLPGAKKMRESFVPGVFTYAETVEDSSLFDNKQWVDRLNVGRRQAPRL